MLVVNTVPAVTDQIDRALCRFTSFPNSSDPSYLGSVVATRSSTLNRNAATMPVELQFQIAKDLSVDDLRKYMRSCRMAHDVGASLLYRSVHCTQVNGRAVFAGLLQRFDSSAENHIRSAPAFYVKSLCYQSGSVDEDLHLIPMLCDVLTHTHNLHHLHINIDPRSAGNLLHMLKRRGLVRDSPSVAAVAFEGVVAGKSESVTHRASRMAVCKLTLPRLAVLHASSHTILAGMGHLRNLRALVVDQNTTKKQMIQLLDVFGSDGRGSTISSFTCFYNVDHPEGLLWALCVTFPRLRYLGMVVPTTASFYRGSAASYRLLKVSGAVACSMEVVI